MSVTNLNQEFSSDINDHFPFPSQRPTQTQALEEVQAAFRGSKKYFILEGPTGFGKSGVGIAAGSWAKTFSSGNHERGAYYLSPQKVLTAQLVNDFASLGLVELRGQANYTCHHFTERNNGMEIDCEMAAMLYEEEHNIDTCTGYKPAKRIFQDSPLGVTNFDYYLNETMHAGQLKNRNLLVLDEAHNCECHPPDTLVRICTGYQRFGLRGKKALIEEFPISSLTDSNRVVSWKRKDYCVHMSGRPISVASRFYSGPMLTVTAVTGKTRVTPNHWFWVRLNSKTRSKHILYLMHKEGVGYRIGVTKFKGASNSFGLAARMKQEQADKGWVLGLYGTYSEAAKFEKIFSLKYGIADTCFKERPFAISAADIKEIFDSTNPKGALQCLADHGRMAEFPIIESGRPKHKGFFKVRACNLIPEVMDIPAVSKRARGKSRSRSATVPLLSVMAKHYEGLVYSLDVEKDHTYIADGLIVGNSKILGFTDTVIDKDRCTRYGVVGGLPIFESGNNEKVADWLHAEFVPASETHVWELKSQITSAKEAGDKELTIKLLKKVQAVERFMGQLNFFLNAEDRRDWLAWSDWDAEKRKGTTDLAIKPLTATLFADDILFSKADKVLLMSATILDFPTFMRNLGINPKDAACLAVDSEFPLENRPIFFKPCGNMGFRHKAKTLPRMAEFLAKILRKYATKKGIVHTHSYENNRYFIDFLRAEFGFRIITHDNSKGSRDRAVMEHISSPEPTVLFSPSMTEGLDLKEDLARFCVITKVPYPFLDTYTKARMQRDPAYYQWLTGLTLVQATGRSVRSKTDKAHTYILDEGFRDFFNRNQVTTTESIALPKWWVDSIIGLE